MSKDEKKIVYLLGAGASKEKIPVVKDFTNDVISILNDVWNSHPNRSAIPKFRLDIDWLIQEGRKHKSLDTLAKRFWLQDDISNLRRLKALISLYFYWKQVPYLYDMRYDSFLATLLERNGAKLKLPDEINLIAWNYDLQFEIALINYTKQHLLNEIYTEWKIHPGSRLGKENPLLTKLNGSASLYFHEDDPQQIKFMNSNLAIVKNDPGTNMQLVSCYERLRDDPSNNSFINFAWEENSISRAGLKFAEKILNGATHLVIIGYSFPVFNKKIDDLLIKYFFADLGTISRVLGHKLRIYIQDPHAEKIVSLLKTRFPLIKGFIHSDYGEFLKIYSQTDCDQFLIPDDLE